MNAQNETIMLIKNKIIDICSKIMDIQNNTRLTRFLMSFARYDRNMSPQAKEYL